MKKLFLFFALMLTVCSTAMAQGLYLESEVGTVGTLNGREAMVVDLGGTIGKVAIATKNVGAEQGEALKDYGTHFTPADANDADKNGLADGWYVPSKKEIDALKDNLTLNKPYHCVEWKVTETATLYFPCWYGNGTYKGDYVSSKRTEWSSGWQCYIYGFTFDNSGNAGYGADNYKESEKTDCAIRPFHKLPSIEELRTIWYTSSDGKVVTPNYVNFGDAKIVSNVYDEETGKGCIKFDGDVTSIGYRAFSDCSGLTSLTIPNSVTSIGYFAFSGCSGLTSVVIPNKITSIGNYAFLGCSGLTSLTIPNSVTSIGDEEFSGCSGLTSLTIPNSVTNIEYRAFSDCSGLTSLTIPNSVTSIGNYAFSGCSGLTSLTIPNSVTSIGNYAFSGCSGLTSLTIPNSVTNIEYRAFSGCSGLTSLTITNGVKSIGDEAFSGCSGLTSLTIPSSVTSIGNQAFSGCSGLNSITIQSNEANIAQTAFKDCYVYSFVCEYLNAEENNYWGAEVCDSQGLVIKDNVVIACAKKATSVIIPSGVTSIGDNAFNGCSNLISITIPSGVTSIGERAFEDCSGLTSLIIPSGVTSIGGAAFLGCSRLTSFIIPNGVTSIGHAAFSNCSSLISITIPSGITIIDGATFSGCTSLTSIAIPSGVTSIEDRAFDGCSSLTSITIPEGVTSIGGESGFHVFRNCSSLKSITLPSSLEKMTLGLHFEGCSNLIYAEFLGETAPVWQTTRPDRNPFAESGIEVGGTVLLVPNDDAVDKYTAADYTNVYSILLPISEFKSIFLSEIEKAMKDVTLTQDDADIVTACQTNINNATDLMTILQERAKALFVINLQKAKDTAIAEIDATLNSYTAVLTQEDIDILNKCKLNILKATRIGMVKTEISSILPIERKLAKEYLRSLYANVSLYITESDFKPYFDRIDKVESWADIDKIVKEAQSVFDNQLKNIPHFEIGEQKYLVEPLEGYEYHRRANYYGDLSYSDGVTYWSNSIVELENTKKIEFTRSLPECVWQCWYEPFYVKVDTEKFDAAEVAYVAINAKEEVEVWFKRMENGATMKPNTIYVIRAKEGQGNLTIEASRPILYTSMESQLTLQSAYENFTLTGNYSPVEHGDWFTLDKSGTFRPMASGKLKPQRFYLTITPREDAYYSVNHSYVKKFVNIMVMGDEEDVTGITPTASPEESHVAYDLIGQRLNSIQKGQIYIMNGKKYIGK